LELAERIQRLYKAKKDVTTAIEDLILESDSVMSHQRHVTKGEISDIGLVLAKSDVALSKAMVEVMNFKVALATMGFEQAGGDMSNLDHK
jgi:hypothetical protein